METPTTSIPPAFDDDDEDVHWALSTASALWARGERAEALRWLRRAAEAASDANADDRAVDLFKAAAAVAASIDAASEPAETPVPLPPRPPVAPRAEGSSPNLPFELRVPAAGGPRARVTLPETPAARGVPKPAQPMASPSTGRIAPQRSATSASSSRPPTRTTSNHAGAQRGGQAPRAPAAWTGSTGGRDAPAQPEAPSQVRTKPPSEPRSIDDEITAPESAISAGLSFDDLDEETNVLVSASELALVAPAPPPIVEERTPRPASQQPSPPSDRPSRSSAAALPTALPAITVAVLGADEAGLIRVLPLTAGQAPPEGAAVAMLVPTTPEHGNMLLQVLAARG
jgi:hypothetical protein